MRISRTRTTAVAAVAGVSLIALSACSSDDSSDANDTAEATDAATSDTTGTTDGEFPATVDTKFGEITVEAAPERVVALGWGDSETALALGVQPVGASDWLGFGGDGVGPWADGLYDASPEIIDANEPSYEAIAALEPDLILDTKGSGDQERYDRLSEIAPTIGVPEGGESWLTSSEDQVEMISEALGMEDAGDQLLDDLDAKFEAAAEAHPEWDDMTMTAATRYSEGWGAYLEGDARFDFLEELGFDQNPEVEKLGEDVDSFFVSISSEQLDLLDAGVIVAFPIGIETTEITEDAVWKAIPAVADGHSVVVDGDLSSAYSLGSTLSTAYALDELVPMLEDATK
ncbi:ABC transporter substrate-binding protein [Paraoerskovia sediminicola]|uniref:ABC transporter substrate-binding protein n=1 Tax=Paraoerskovia sediminicola TaxID=1138587 RepID=A0ABN6XCG9_9CELL|nr:iron-siderophore ABC transporter substrate-binding protein [Paraoerskovia sediminicola]BDZ41808.1 ABC transporter substrate-binding protein [Paraoerskovia sediminicola]